MQTAVTTTYLEMTSAAEIAPYHGDRRLAVRRAEVPCPELNRFFYAAVGSDWWWYSRLTWTREQWLEWTARPSLETWIASLSGTPAGYFELDRQAAGDVEVAHLGLLPSFVGHGLGRELVTSALERAWQSEESRRVWLHTSSLDHPRALPNYEACGLRRFKTEEDMEALPDEPPRLWPVSRSSA